MFRDDDDDVDVVCEGGQTDERAQKHAATMNVVGSDFLDRDSSQFNFVHERRDILCPRIEFVAGMEPFMFSLVRVEA